MCSIYAAAVRRALPDAQLAVDLFHVVHLAVKMTGDVRRRAVRAKYGRRGRPGDPEYGIKNLLVRDLEQGAAGGPGKPTGSNPGRAPRSDPTITCHAQLRLARGLAADLRLPWQRPCPPGRLTPARVRRGVPQHPPGAPGSGRRAETRQTRPRTPARIEEPAPGHPSRRGQDRQAR